MLRGRSADSGGMVDAWTAPRGRRDEWPVWAWLGLGLLTAPVFGLTPLLSSIGWFLGALVHELGHTAMAWFLGCPAIPSLSLGGEAATVHFEPYVMLQVVVALAIGAGVQRHFSARLGQAVAGVAAAGCTGLYGLIVWTGATEALHLLGGHLGELVIGSMFLFRCGTGVATAHAVERGLAGTLGTYLVGRNLGLSAGLAFSESARLDYAGNRSFGIENDYVRLAADSGLSLAGIGFVMSLTALGFWAAAWLLSMVWRSARG